MEDDELLELSAVTVFHQITNTVELVTSLIRLNIDYAPNRHLQRRSLASICENLTDFEFRRSFRMKQATFWKLVNHLRPSLEKDIEMGARSSSGSISIDVQVDSFLRILAGSQYLDIMILFGIARSTVYAIVRLVYVAIIKIFLFLGSVVLEKL